MIGVLIVVGIIAYGIVYSGLSELPSSKIPPTSIIDSLKPPSTKAKPSDFPKPKGKVPGPATAPKVGRK